MADVNILAEVRELTTKGAVNQLRRDGKVPAVLYSKEMEPISISVSELGLKPIVYTTEMQLVNIKIGEKEIKSILKDIQFDPVTDRIIHVDFQAIKVGQVIQVQVPISIVGQSIGVKKGGRLIQHIHKVDVECLPKDIPQHLELDITNLDVGQSILVRDLNYEALKILNSSDISIIAITSSRSMDEDLPESGEEPVATEPELISKGKSEEAEG